MSLGAFDSFLRFSNSYNLSSLHSSNDQTFTVLIGVSNISIPEY